MFIRALQTKHVFACHCEVLDHFIKVGMLFVGDRDLAGQQVTLLQTDNPEGDRYTVALPPLFSRTLHDVELTRVS